MKYMWNLPKNSRGFTLIELLVVIAIIGLLASVVLASLGSARTSARDSKRLSQARELVKALEIYRNKNNGYPCSGEVVVDEATMNCSGSVNNGSANSFIIRGPGGVYISREKISKTVLGFNPENDPISWSLDYIVRNTGTANRADRNSYTIIVGQEDGSSFTSLPSYSKMKFCKITAGVADITSVVDSTHVKDIVDCPISGVK